MYHSIQSELRLLNSDASYGAIVNSEGQFLCHPEIDFVINGRRVNHFGEALETGQQIADLPKMPKWPNFRYLEEFRLTRSNQNHFLVFSPIASTGCWIMIALDEHRLYNRPEVIHRNRAQQIQILIAALIFLVSFVAVVARVDRGTQFSFWVVSWTIAGASLLGMILLWMLNITSQDDRGTNEYRLTNHAIVAKQLIRLHTEDHLEISSIPTGVHLQSIQFLEAYNVKLTGYIWQSYSDDLPEWMVPTDDGEPGFVLPEAEELEIQKALNHRYEDREVFVWYFETVLRQSFQFDRYPFDQLNVWLRLWPRHFDRAVVLTPDLDSYYTLDPTQLPGIEHNDFVLEGWHLNENYFSYRTNRYSSDFGMHSLRQVDQVGYPELYFNVTMRRNPLTPFIANVIPQLVVALLLFSVALTIRTDETKSQLMGFNTNTVLGFNAALFFVVIIGHVSLRENLGAEGITYLEWLYFISYLAILGVTVNALMAGALRDHFLVRYGDNLLIRQTYWPLYMGSLFLISLWTFS
ncbi:MAG: hypothetical protein HUJ26_00125 [Planctomycetaceae bacterium]|nr:hypothetical protein [Planctomycetaceae bacterium]